MHSTYYNLSLKQVEATVEGEMRIGGMDTAHIVIVLSLLSNTSMRHNATSQGFSSSCLLPSLDSTD